MKALKISILGAGLLSLISCNEFLDRYPYSENSSSTMFSSATLAESVVTGGYSNLLYDYNSTDRSVLNWDSFSSVMDPQEGIVNLDYNYLFGTLQPNNSMFQTYWKRFYEGINRANDVIENIGRVPDMSDATKAKRIAECKFLRAYHYYRLNALWRGVPYYDRNLAPDEYRLGRSSEEEIWRLVVKDCTDCIDCSEIPDRYVSGNADYGRVTRGAAYALRGKAYMWLKQYDLAEADFGKVGECGYDLYTDSYESLFTETNEKCEEMVFSVQMVEEEGQGNAFSNNYGNYCTVGYGKYQHYLNVNFIDSFEEVDGKPFSWDDYFPGYSSMTPEARSVYFLRNGLTDTEKTAMSTYGADMSKYDALGNEVRLRAAYENRDPRLAAIAITPYSTYDGGASGTVVTYTSRYPYRDWQAPSLDLRYGNNAYMLYPIRKFVTKGREYTNIGYNPVDVPIIRYADVLLMYAEAVWRAHEVPSPEALEYVNQVRRRGFGVDIKTPNEAVDLKMMDGDKFAEALLAERSFELCFEGQRWYDLVRFGKLEEGVKKLAKYSSVATSQAQNFQPKHVIFPIPQDVIDASNGKIEQNPLWK